MTAPLPVCREGHNRTLDKVCFDRIPPDYMQEHCSHQRLHAPIALAPLTLVKSRE